MPNFEKSEKKYQFIEHVASLRAIKHAPSEPTAGLKMVPHGHHCPSQGHVLNKPLNGGWATWA